MYATGSSRLSHIIALDFPSGSRACIWFSPTGTFRYPKELYELTDHFALFRNLCFVETQIYGRGEPEITHFDLQHDELPGVGTEGGLAGYIAKLNERARLYAESNGAQWPNVSPDSGHAQLLEAESDPDDTPPTMSGRGARTHLSLRAIESIRSGSPVPINVEELRFFVD